MKAQITEYKSKSIRFTVVEDNGILFNTKDVCAVLDIIERLPDGLFS